MKPSVFFGGEEQVAGLAEVRSGGCPLGFEKVRLAAPHVAFKITAITSGLEAYEDHLRRFLRHTNLITIQWVNITRARVTFKTILPAD